MLSYVYHTLHTFRKVFARRATRALNTSDNRTPQTKTPRPP